MLSLERFLRGKESSLESSFWSLQTSLISFLSQFLTDFISLITNSACSLKWTALEITLNAFLKGLEIELMMQTDKKLGCSQRLSLVCKETFSWVMEDLRKFALLFFSYNSLEKYSAKVKESHFQNLVRGLWVKKHISLVILHSLLCLPIPWCSIFDKLLFTHWVSSLYFIGFKTSFSNNSQTSTWSKKYYMTSPK